MPCQDELRIRRHRSDAGRDVISSDVRVNYFNLVLANEIGDADRTKNAKRIADGDLEMVVSGKKIQLMLPFARRAIGHKDVMAPVGKPARKVDKMPLAAAVSACR